MFAYSRQWSGLVPIYRLTDLCSIAEKRCIFVILFYCFCVELYRPWPVMFGKGLVALELQSGGGFDISRRHSEER